MQTNTHGDKQRPPALIVFYCSLCGGKNKCGLDMAGAQVVCPRCGKQIRIPAPHAEAVAATPDVPTVVPTGEFIYLCESCGARHVCAPEAFGQELACEKCRRAQKIENLVPHKTIKIVPTSMGTTVFRFLGVASLFLAIVGVVVAVGVRSESFIDASDLIPAIIACFLASPVFYFSAYLFQAMDRIRWGCDQLAGIGLPEYRKK